MNPSTPFGYAFRRAVGLFPKPSVTVTGGAGEWLAGGFCAVSFEPAIVALTFSGAAPDRPGELLTVAANGVTLRGSLMESRPIGDHTMLLVTVDGASIGVDPPSITWRRASFGLQLNYPFLESPAALEKFVDDWRTGVLPKKAWTHAAHVAVTGYYAFDCPLETVIDEMRRGILHFNICVGTVNGPDSGYHETLTQFWSTTIARVVREAPPDSNLRSRFDAARYAVRLLGEDRDLPALYYSFDVVRDRQARREWTPPDLDPQPEWCGAWAATS